MVPVARRNLLAEKGRFAISVAGVGVAILLILIVLALYRGWSRTGSILADMPGDIWVVQRGTVDPFHSASILPKSQLAGLDAIPGVAAATPVLARRMMFETADGEASIYILALDASRSQAGPSPDASNYFPPKGQINIDRVLQRKTGLASGSQSEIGGLQVTVGQVAPNQGEAFVQFVFAEFSDAQQMFGVEGAVNFEILSLSPGADAAAVIRAVGELDPRLQAFTREEFAHSVRKEIDDSFLPIIAILTVIGFTVGAAVVGLTIYTATIERTREFGVMKAVGASGAYLYRIVFTQSLILTLTGFALGTGAAIGVARLATQAVPDFATEFRLSDVVTVLGVTGLMALVASFIPIRRVLAVDPASVFRA